MLEKVTVLWIIYIHKSDSDSDTNVNTIPTVGSWDGNLKLTV